MKILRDFGEIDVKKNGCWARVVATPSSAMTENDSVGFQQSLHLSGYSIVIPGCDNLRVEITSSGVTV